MPELPEVQTIVSDLNSRLKNHKIEKIWTDWPKSFSPGLAKVKKDIVGKKILRVRRRAKNILIDFSDNKTLLIHLKMTGHLLFRRQDWKAKSAKENPFNDPYNQFIRTVFYLNKNMELAFSDLRRFGEIWLYNTKDENKIPRFQKLGPEPLDKKFTLKIFEQRLQKRNGLLKSVLLDQHVIAGIGNIYADEVLWESRLSPTRRVSKLTGDERKRIYNAIKKILKKAVANRGTSMSDYRDALGKKGNYQNLRKVYKRDGEKCYRCKGILKRTKVNNRGTTYCSNCQK